LDDLYTDSSEPLAIFWDAILSRESKRILAAAQPLDVATRNALIAHLTRMATEPDWHPEQVKSARTALAVLARIS
jgi:hypothetical protein